VVHRHFPPPEKSERTRRKLRCFDFERNTVLAVKIAPQKPYSLSLEICRPAPLLGRPARCWLRAFCYYFPNLQGFLYFNPAPAQLACVLNPSTFAPRVGRSPGPGSTPPGRLSNAGLVSAKRSQKRIQSSLKVCVMVVRSTNPEDRIRRIRDLCARAAETDDADEIKEVTSQLRRELHEQIAYLKEMVAVHRGCIP
jgi:hypothetical protein